MPPPPARTRTRLLSFQARKRFRFNQQNASPAALQEGRAGERCYTSSESFANQVLLRQPDQFRILETAAALPCLPREAWAETDFAGAAVLFLLPSQALGNNVSTLLFLHAFAERWGTRKIGVFCARSTSDIYLATRLVQVYPLWIAERELGRWSHVIDLGHLESRRNIDIWPVDMEADLLEAFRLRPAARFPAEARPMRPRGRPAIGILPLASSPLRTLPPPVTVALAEALAAEGDVTICLNRTQRQGQLYEAALAGRLPAGVRLVEGFPTIAELLRAIDRFDWAVYADSGPAHMTKLYAAPGMAVYSSAPASVLQGRFRNLVNWTIPFAGPYCATPCGLAKVRKAADGRVGCMGSLGLTLDELPHLPGRADAAVVERLQREPVPCLASLAADPAPLAAAAVAAFRRALAPAPGSG